MPLAKNRLTIQKEANTNTVSKKIFISADHGMAIIYITRRRMQSHPSSCWFIPVPMQEIRDRNCNKESAWVGGNPQHPCQLPPGFPFLQGHVQ
jgi:hypothetical protein